MEDVSFQILLGGVSSSKCPQKCRELLRGCAVKSVRELALVKPPVRGAEWLLLRAEPLLLSPLEQFPLLRAIKRMKHLHTLKINEHNFFEKRLNNAN